MRFHNFVGERSLIKSLIDTLSEGDVFYDIGANVGAYTCFAAAELGPTKTVAFEPEPKNIGRLRENLELNNLNAKILQIALSNGNSTVDFALSGDEAGEGEHAIATGDDERTLEVDTARGDSIIEERGLPKPTVLKIDVEGAELSVLRGLRETLHENCRLVYVEVHTEKIRDFGGEASEVETLLTDAGFEVTEISQRGSEVFLRASK
jgi:FkbM family methyltransferase